MKTWIALVAVALALPVTVHGETVSASRVEALDGNIKCNWARDRLITVISGPCEDYTPPRQVRMGETFKANGKTKTINIVIADRIEKDMPRLGLRAGDWTCMAAESQTDVPGFSGKQDHTGTWLYIGKCKPLE
jgi:hypothetical protein